MGKKVAATIGSKLSSTSTPATAASSTASSNKSSILRSSFAPSHLQLHLFASVIQSFDSQQLRIHDTNTGRLRQQHAARSGTVISSLDWGYYASSNRESSQSSNKKKRKRGQTTEDVVVAYGTSGSEICMFSPTQGRIVGTLSGVHEGGIADFKFSLGNGSEAWSIGGDGKLVQWDLSKDQAVKSLPLPDPSTSILSSPSLHEPRLLCASTTTFAISPSEDFRIDTFDSFKAKVHSLIRSGKSTSNIPEVFLAADNDRYINLFDIQARKLVRTLVTGSEVEQLSCSSVSHSTNPEQGQILAAVTKDGVIELFSHPFKLPSVTNGEIKSKRKSMTRKASAQVRLVSPDKKPFRILSASVSGPDLVIVSVDGGIDPNFQKLRWQDEGTSELLFEGVKEITKVKSTSTLNAAQLNGVKNMGKTHIDESRTVVVNGTDDAIFQDDAIEISSGEDSDDEDVEASEAESGVEVAVGQEDESADDSEGDVEQDGSKALVNQNDAAEDAVMEDVEAQEPSFGDLLALKHPNTIAIADTFVPEKSVYDANKQLALPSGMSLGTVLTQALRTNDTNLLESCLHANDAGIIQNTIQRLDSTLAANLLSKLAERLASRPGRYGHLLSWVQWTCIAHGGVIAGQPDVAARIKTLYKVLTQRSQSLEKLLLLKGKLDMLDAQLSLRKQLQAQQGSHRQDQGEPGMIYIEGEEDNWSSDEDFDEAVGITKRIKGSKTKARALEDFVGREASSEDEDEDEMPTTNGVDTDDSDMEETSEDETDVNRRSKGGAYDIEAEVSDDDGSGDDEEEGDDVDDSDEDEDEEDDSSMDNFINDGEISYASEEEGIDLDEEPETRKPEKKKTKHR